MDGGEVIRIIQPIVSSLVILFLLWRCIHLGNEVIKANSRAAKAENESTYWERYAKQYEEALHHRIEDERNQVRRRAE